MRFTHWIAVLALALGLAVGLTACGDDDGESGTDTTAERTTDTGETGSTNGVDEPSENGTDGDEGDGGGPDDENLGPARSEEIDELLTMHPIFPVKRFMNFAARGNPGACSLLSAQGRSAMRAAHDGASCEEVIRAAAAERDGLGLTIGGEFVPIGDFSDLEFPTTIYVLETEQGRVTPEGEPRPFVLSRYGEVWLINKIPLAEIGTTR